MNPIRPSWSLLITVLVAATGTAAAQTTEREYQDWALRCPEQAPCVLEQRVFVENVEQGPVVHMGFQALEEPPQLLGVLRVPLGVLLGPGIQIRIDQGEPQTIPIHHCRTQGCIALFPLISELRQALEAGRAAEVGFHTLDGSRVGVPVSLLGITAGLKALSTMNTTASRQDKGETE